MAIFFGLLGLSSFIFFLRACAGYTRLWDCEKAYALRHWWPGWVLFYVLSIPFVYATLLAGFSFGAHFLAPGNNKGGPYTAVVFVLALMSGISLFLMTLRIFYIIVAIARKKPHMVIELPYTFLNYEQLLGEWCRIHEYLCHRLRQHCGSSIRIGAVCHRPNLDAMLIWIPGRFALVLECMNAEDPDTIRLHCIRMDVSPVTQNVCTEIGRMLKGIGVPVAEGAWKLIENPSRRAAPPKPPKPDNEWKHTRNRRNRLK